MNIDDLMSLCQKKAEQDGLYAIALAILLTKERGQKVKAILVPMIGQGAVSNEKRRLLEDFLCGMVKDTMQCKKDDLLQSFNRYVSRLKLSEFSSVEFGKMLSAVTTHEITNHRSRANGSLSKRTLVITRRRPKSDPLAEL